MRTVILLVILVLLAIAVLVISLVPLMEVAYYESEAYVTTETFYRTIVSTEEIPIDYEVADPEVSNLWWRTTSDCSLVLKNTGIEGGFFRVEFNLVTQDEEDITKVVWQYLDVGEQWRVVVRHDEDYVRSFNAVENASSYSVTPPVQVIETSQEVPDTREVTKMRQVERTKRVPIFEYLREWR